MNEQYLTALLVALGSCALSPCLSAQLCYFLGRQNLLRLSTPLSLLATGFILALGLGHILPEACEQAEAHEIGAAALIAVLTLAGIEMFLGTKNVHRHEKNGVHRALSHGGAALLAGTLLHTFCDGVIIVSAYMADLHVGLAVTLAVIMHEVAHELGDYALMLALGMSPKAAYSVNLTALAGSLGGGVCALAVFTGFEALLPYALAVSSASFIYVALSALLPRLKITENRLKALQHFVLIVLGAVLCLLLTAHE